MSRMITIQIDSEDMKDMLYDRVRYWTDDSEVLELFEQYYDNMVDCGCYDGGTFDVMSIVDNDYVNYTSIIDREEFEKAREEYIRDDIKEYIKENRDFYDEDEHAEWVADLKAHIEDLKGEAPTWEDVQDSREVPDFLDVDYIEAMTDNLILVRY